jgi:hypothetical protein
VEVERRLVVMPLGWGHQRRQNDAGLAAIDDVVIVVAEAEVRGARSERGGV